MNKKMNNNSKKNDLESLRDKMNKRITNDDRTTEINRFLNIDRIKAVDRQANLYDKTRPVTNNDKGLSGNFDENGNLVLPERLSDAERIQQSEERIKEAYQKQVNERNTILRENYEYYRSNIMQHLNSVIDSIDKIDKLFYEK